MVLRRGVCTNFSKQVGALNKAYDLPENPAGQSHARWAMKEMNLSNNKVTWRQKWKLCRSAVFSTLLTILASGMPLLMILDYKSLGYIYVGKGHVHTAKGNDALIVIWGVSAGILIMWVFALYHLVQCGKKIWKGELETETKLHEIMICTKCGVAQKTKDLIKDHCNKCRGIVDNVEGFYDRHPYLKRKHKM